MIIETMKTAYFRGRGGQRIRKTILLTTEDDGADPPVPIDGYATAAGFYDGNTMLPPDLQGVLIAPIRNATLRTIEPRFRLLEEIPFENLGGTHCILDISGFDLPTTNRVHIRAYGVDVGGGTGIIEGATISPPDLPAGVSIPIEIEYTSNSGAEG